ncbi:MAG TPA: hypothetical protein VN962_23210 [Polyangia bacterium]|nr:hypothetical protein [Polyangia bacterium]
MTRLKALALAAVLLTGWAAAPARAEPASANDETTASALVEQAAHAYDDNQLDEALRLLSRAYQLSPRASIVYNQAQVLRAKDDCAGALDAYRRFIDTAAADDANRERAAHWRDEMQACVDRRAPPPAPVKLAAPEPARPDPSAGVVVRAAETPGQTASPHRRAMRVTGWALLGASVVATGAAVALAWQAHNIQNELNGDLQRNTGPGFLTWTSDLESRAQDGQLAATGAWLCAGFAALAGGGSAALFILSRPAAGNDPPGPARTALLGWSGTF